MKRIIAEGHAQDRAQIQKLFQMLKPDSQTQISGQQKTDLKSIEAELTNRTKNQEILTMLKTVISEVLKDRKKSAKNAEKNFRDQAKELKKIKKVIIGFTQKNDKKRMDMV